MYFSFYLTYSLLLFQPLLPLNIMIGHLSCSLDWNDVPLQCFFHSFNFSFLWSSSSFRTWGSRVVLYSWRWLFLVTCEHAWKMAKLFYFLPVEILRTGFYTYFRSRVCFSPPVPFRDAQYLTKAFHLTGRDFPSPCFAIYFYIWPK